MNGKGDAPRNCFSDTYRENYDTIFRKKTLDGINKPSNKKTRQDENETTERGLRGTARPSRRDNGGMDELLPSTGLPRTTGGG